MIVPMDAKQYIGMKEAEAIKTGEASGLKVYVWDVKAGKIGAVTCEIDSRRLQLIVENGIVTHAELG